MKKLAFATCGAATILMLLSGLSSAGPLASLGSAFDMIGGSSSIKSIASNFVNAALKDPRLAGLLSGKKVDPAATSGKVSDQLCALLGGGCKAPLTDSQLASSASKVSPEQSKAISDHFSSALNKVVSDPMVREAVTKALGNKIPGVLAGLL
jgi:truncated hemoglobin YjbI